MTYDALVGNWRRGATWVTQLLAAAAMLATLPPATASGRQLAHAVPVRKILFRSNRDGLGNLYVVDRDGGGLRQLTNDKSGRPALFASWSPNGRQIAFNRDGGLDSTFIWVMNGDGSGLRRLVEGQHPVWSPSSEKIAYDCPSHGHEYICVINASGNGGPARIMPVAGFVSFNFPDWSRTNRLAFQCSTPAAEVTRVCAESPDGGQAAALTAGGGTGHGQPRGDYQPHWSPDGRKVAFLGGGNSEEWGVHAVVADAGGSARSDVSGTTIGCCLLWSPDSRSVSFVDINSKLWVVGLGDANKPVGARRIDVIGGGFAWSPDSREVAYIGEGHDIWVSRLQAPRGQGIDVGILDKPIRLTNGIQASALVFQPLP